MGTRDRRGRDRPRPGLLLGFMAVLVPLIFLPGRSLTSEGERVYKHGPYSFGRCGSCHTAHEAGAPAGLVTTEKQLCFLCHADTETRFAFGVRHAPVREQPCSVCHDPHQSPWPKMLKKPQSELCLDCHPKIKAELARPSTHQPAKEGRCTDCHDPHNSQYPHLLKRPFDQEFYVSFATRKFALCFGCHASALATEPTGSRTGFRDGSESIHYFHVNDPLKGRSCWVCHEAHGGNQDRLIKDQVSFGKWRLPIVFTRMVDGGGCLAGCHKYLGYQR